MMVARFSRSLQQLVEPAPTHPDCSPPAGPCDPLSPPPCSGCVPRVRSRIKHLHNTLLSTRTAGLTTFPLALARTDSPLPCTHKHAHPPAVVCKAAAHQPASPQAAAAAAAPAGGAKLTAASPSGTAQDYAQFAAAARSGANVVPLVQRLFSDQLTPVMAYRCLVKEDDQSAPSFLFESVVNGDQQGRYSFVGGLPAMEVVATQNRVVVMDHEKGTKKVSVEADPMLVSTDMCIHMCLYVHVCVRARMSVMDHQGVRGGGPHAGECV